MSGYLRKCLLTFPVQIESILFPFNCVSAKLFNWDFHSLEIVSRQRDPQQVSENYSHLTKWRSMILQSC